MRTIRPIIFITAILLFLMAPPAEAFLYQTGDPNFGPDSVIVDTSTGLGWLRLTETTGLSYDQVLADTQSGGTLSGYRFATVQQVLTLYSSAGIPGPGYYPLSSPSIQSLISLFGPTQSFQGYPALAGFSATPYDGLQECPQIYASGVNSSLDYLVSGPDFFRLAVNPTLGSADLGSWLVEDVPEPSEMSIFVLSIALWVGSVHLQRKQRPSDNTPHSTPGGAVVCKSRLSHAGSEL